MCYFNACRQGHDLVILPRIDEVLISLTVHHDLIGVDGPCKGKENSRSEVLAFEFEVVE